MKGPPPPDAAIPSLPSRPSLGSLALALVSGVGPVRWRRLVAEHGSPAAALTMVAGEAGARAACARAAELRAECQRKGVALLTLDDAGYPTRLHALEDPPNPLFRMGTEEPWGKPGVALVGARHATAAGRRAARRFAAALAREGVCVVSGMAAGIDAEAHAGALGAEGSTVAVLGTGVDVPYPQGNTALHAAVVRRGVVLSESPPGARAHPGAFPRRNRIIAALADVVVVVEAGARSGALITAQLADTLGRLVAAVPGPIDDEYCVGSNALLRDGAHVVTTPDDVLAMLSLAPRAAPGQQAAVSGGGSGAGMASAWTPAELPVADTAERRILEVLAAGPRFADDLVRVAGGGAREIGTALSLLSLSGLVDVDAGGLVFRR